MNCLIRAGLEQNCFEKLLDFSISLIEQARSLLQADRVKDIKDLLEWLGIIGAGAGSVFWLYRRYKGLPIPKEDVLESNDMHIKIKGDNNQVTIIEKPVLHIYEDTACSQYAQQFLGAMNTEGIDCIEFENYENTTQLNKSEYAEFLNTKISTPQMKKTDITNITIRHLLVLKPELREDAMEWVFDLDGKTIKADISQTEIAKSAMRRGEIRVGDTYKVRLEEQEYKSSTGRYSVKYKVLEVQEFIRGSKQSSFDFGFEEKAKLGEY